MVYKSRGTSMVSHRVFPTLGNGFPIRSTSRAGSQRGACCATAGCAARQRLRLRADRPDPRAAAAERRHREVDPDVCGVFAFATDGSTAKIALRIMQAGVAMVEEFVVTAYTSQSGLSAKRAAPTEASANIVNDPGFELDNGSWTLAN